MIFGLEQHIIDNIITVFEANANVDKAFVFGSRAKGNYRPDSDIDIAIKGIDITLDDILKMSMEFEVKGIKNKIDLIDYTSIKEPALKEHIDRVGIEFYSRWKKVKLADVAVKFAMGPFGSNIKAENFISSGVPVIRGTNLNFYKYVDGDFVFLTEDKANDLKSSSCFPGDLVFTHRGTLGQVALIPFGKYDRYIISQSGMKVTINSKLVDNNWLFYFFKSSIGQYELLKNESQVGVPSISNPLTSLKAVELKLPPLPEQIAIASILSSLDDKIDLLQRQNKTLERLSETLFRQWFVEESENSWEEKKLGELLTITSSKRIFYSEYVSSGIPFYRSKEIIELRNTGSTNSELYIPNERFDEINNKFGSPKDGDILMTSVGTLGVAYRVRKTDKFYFKDGNLTWFKDFKGLPSSIVYLWLISKIGQEELAAITIGSTQEALTIEGLKSISFKIPPKERIKLYETEFNTIIDKIEFNQNQVRTLTKTRDTLLLKLMSGEVRMELN